MTIRAPLITRIESRAPLLQEFSNPGRLNDLLKGKDKQFAGSGQWKAYDWPNPTLRKDATFLQAAVRSESDVWSNRLLDLLKGKDKQFAGSGQWKTYDYPNPSGPQFPVDLYTFVNPLELQLIGKDKQFAGQGQWKAYDWPNPLIPRTPDYGEWINAILPLGGTAVFRKFIQLRELYLQRPFIQHEFYQNLLATTLNPVANLPRQPAYAPYRTVRVTTDDPVPNLLTTTLGASGQAPFAQEDWPNPLGPSYRDTSFIQDLNLQLLGQDQFFGAPGQGPANLDWINPRGPARIDLTWLQSSPQVQVTQVSPFNLKDWPNPAGSAFPQDLRGYIQDLNLVLLGQDKFFGAPGQGPANLDWPVPKGPVGGIELRTWLVNLSQGTLAPAFVQPPFNFTDWKNPWAAGFPLDLRSFLDANRLNNPIPPFVPIVVKVPPVGGGASGAKRYRQPAWWGDEKKRKLEKKVVAVQKLIQKKREQIDFAPDLLRMERLVEQLQELQKRLMKLLEQIEELNKKAEEEEVIRIYTIYRSLH